MKKILSIIIVIHYLNTVKAQTLIKHSELEKGTSISNIFNYNGKMFFLKHHPTYRTLMYSDRKNKPQVFKHLSIKQASRFSFSNKYNAVVFNKKVYYSFQDSLTGRELWSFDENTDAHLVKDIYPGGRVSGGKFWPKNGAPNGFFVFKENMYFIAEHTDGDRYFWKMDAQENFSRMSKMQYYSITQKNWATEFNGKIYFSAAGTNNYNTNHELMVFDGVNPPTLAMDLWPERRKSSNPQYLTVFNNKLYFQAKVNDTIELFEYTTHGILSKININQCKSSNPQYLTVVKNKLFLQAFDCVLLKKKLGPELMSINANNQISYVVDVNPKNNTHGNPSEMINYKGKLYFVATVRQASYSGRQIFVHDPITNKTKQLTSYYPTQTFNKDNPVYHLHIYDNSLWFYGATLDNKKSALWRIDDQSSMVTKIQNNFIKVYPNPSKNKVFFTTNSSESYQLIVKNSIGQVILKQILTQDKVDVNIKKTGIYLFQYLNLKTQEIYNTKIIINK